MATKYTIKAADGTIHAFKTLKAAKASNVGWGIGGMRIINHERTAAKKRQAAEPIFAANQPNQGAAA